MNEKKPSYFVTGTRLSAMMFLEFFVWGAWYVTVGNYMNANNMGTMIAWAYSLCPIGAIISPFFLGMVADRFFATERVLAVLHIIGGIALVLTPMALLAALLDLADDYAAGRKRPKVYYHFKMYNDPRLNPELYGRRAEG